MKLSFIAIVLSMAAAGMSAHAVSLTVKEGNYQDGYIYYGGPVTKGNFEIRQRGQLIRFIDTKNNIVYSLDLNNSQEQFLPAKYLDFQRKNILIGPVRETLQNFSVKVLGQGKTKDELKGIAYVYQKFSFAGADIKIKWAFNVTVNSYEKNYDRYDNGVMVPEPRWTINVKGGLVTVANLQTPAPASLNRYFAGVISKMMYYITAPISVINADLYATK